MASEQGQQSLTTQVMDYSRPDQQISADGEDCLPGGHGQNLQSRDNSAPRLRWREYLRSAGQNSTERELAGSESNSGMRSLALSIRERETPARLNPAFTAHLMGVPWWWLSTTTVPTNSGPLETWLSRCRELLHSLC